MFGGSLFLVNTAVRKKEGKKMECIGTSFEESRSFEQELTFNTLQKEMDVRQLAFGRAQMETLKLLGSDKLFTNLAMLLSDQCTHCCKIAVSKAVILQHFGTEENSPGRC